MIAENIRFELFNKPYEHIDFLKEKIVELTGDSYLACESIYEFQRKTILKFHFVCLKHPKQCKTRYLVFLDLNSKLARIYHNEKIHNTNYFHGQRKFTCRVNIIFIWMFNIYYLFVYFHL